MSGAVGSDRRDRDRDRDRDRIKSYQKWHTSFLQVYIYNLAIFSIFLSDIIHVRVRLSVVLLGKRSLKHKHLHTCRNDDLFTSPVTLMSIS